MNRVLQYDQIDLAPTKITHRDDPLFGPITVFHDVPIARTIVQQYEDGLAYKPANELEAAAWTARDRWIVIGRHPDTAIVSNRDDVGGRTTNIRFTNSLINSKTKRPEDRGVLADLEMFDNKVPSDLLLAMKSGTKRDVSIGFFFDQDATPGVIGDDYPQLRGTEYDYVQRNIMIDHTAAALDTGSGRCTFPECGIGADQFKRLVTGDPVGPYKTWAECEAAIRKKNPDYTDEQVKGTCGKMEKQSKDEYVDTLERIIQKQDKTIKSLGKTLGPRLHGVDVIYDERSRDILDKITSKDFKPTDGNNLSMQLTPEAAEKIVEALDIFKQLFVVEDAVEVDDLVSEEYQGNAGAETLSMRAKMHFSISDDEWDALSEEEKDDYINRLPPAKTKAGGEEMSNRDCVYLWDMVRDKLLQKVPDKDRVKVEPAMLQRIITELVFDGDSVIVTAETRDKLIEYGIDLDPCESDDAEADVVDDPEEDEDPVEDSTEQEIDETPSVDLPSTDQVIRETEKVLQDIKRLVG